MTNKTFNKQFFKKLLIIAIPIIFEQILVTSYGIVDTIMVKKFYRGIAGVGIASQILNVAGIIMFAFAIGVGIYISQYFGDKDEENIKNAFSLLLVITTIISIVFFIIGFFFPRQVLGLLTKDKLVLDVAVDYVRIASFAYLPNLLSYAYVTAYRNTQKPSISLMVQGGFAVMNVLLNYSLIFGFWFFPKLGIKGAAWATLISCLLGLIAHIIISFSTKQIFAPKIKNILNAFKISFSKKILYRSFPFFINESLYSAGMLFYTKIFNSMGSNQYEAFKITDNLEMLLLAVSYGINTAVVAMVGAELGKGDSKKAKEYAKGFIYIGLISSIVMGVLIAALAKVMIMPYSSNEISSETIKFAILLMFVVSLKTTLKMFANIFISIFRAGGKSLYVMILDGTIMWVVAIPICYIGYKYLHIENIALLYLLMQIEPVIRIIIAIKKYLKYDWVRNIIDKELVDE